jgi:hypothetical protein
MGLAYHRPPIRVAQYGISSVISIADDELIEKEYFYNQIQTSIPRTQKKQKTTAPKDHLYLDLVDSIVKEKI